MREIRIFISSPSDVANERERAQHVIDGLRRRYSRHFALKIIRWEDLPLRADVPFQVGIDEHILPIETELSDRKEFQSPEFDSNPVHIALFILWSRLGTPLGPRFVNDQSIPYLSGTEWEFDQIIRYKHSENTFPIPLVYVRRDEASFDENLRGLSTAEKKEKVLQKERLENFISSRFKDPVHGHNVGSYHTYIRAEQFSARLHDHLLQTLDDLEGRYNTNPTIWDVASKGSPFRGLAYFDLEHRDVFFGRDREVLEARHAIRSQAKNGCAFLLINGPSGSGKSSLARAGLMPTILENETDNDTGVWHPIVTSPSALGDNPISAIIHLLASDSILPELCGNHISLAEVCNDLTYDANHTIKRWISEAFARAQSRLGSSLRILILIDQFEEFFVRADDKAVNTSKFFEVLEALCCSGFFWVIATLRSDFSPAVQREASLVRMKAGYGQFDLMPPTARDLYAIITEPARIAGLQFERHPKTSVSLEDQIIADASNNIELLPLVEYVLNELFVTRESNGTMTWNSYESLGRLSNAIGRQAERVFQSSSIEAQAELSYIVRGLVTASTGNDGDFVRQRQPVERLADTPARTELVEALVSGRFLTTDNQGGTAVIFFSHEALMRHWSRMSACITNDAELLRIRSRMDVAAKRWAESHQHPDYLLDTEMQLAEARRLAGNRNLALEPLTNHYVDVSVELADRRLKSRLWRWFCVGASVLSFLIAIVYWGATISTSNRKIYKLSDINIQLSQGILRHIFSTCHQAGLKPQLCEAMLRVGDELAQGGCTPGELSNMIDVYDDQSFTVVSMLSRFMSGLTFMEGRYEECEAFSRIQIRASKAIEPPSSRSFIVAQAWTQIGISQKKRKDPRFTESLSKSVLSSADILSLLDNRQLLQSDLLNLGSIYLGQMELFIESGDEANAMAAYSKYVMALRHAVSFEPDFRWKEALRREEADFMIDAAVTLMDVGKLDVAKQVALQASSAWSNIQASIDNQPSDVRYNRPILTTLGVARSIVLMGDLEKVQNRYREAQRHYRDAINLVVRQPDQRGFDDQTDCVKNLTLALFYRRLSQVLPGIADDKEFDKYHNIQRAVDLEEEAAVRWAGRDMDILFGVDGNTSGIDNLRRALGWGRQRMILYPDKY